MLPLATETESRWRDAAKRVARYENAVVAFSGGIDSTLLLKLAIDVLGNARVLAVTADSPSLARQDLEEARRLAEHLQARHEVVQTSELEDPAYQANSPVRCYHCKSHLFKELHELARVHGIGAILYGAIGDDRTDERPGQRAAAEQEIDAPLQHAGLSKAEIRLLARREGLPNWDRPQNACLASRIPHGTPVTAERLERVEKAESAIRAFGFLQVRVRDHGSVAKIELGVDELPQLRDDKASRELIDAVRACGFLDASIDPRGYRAGGAQ